MTELKSYADVNEEKEILDQKKHAKGFFNISNDKKTGKGEIIVADQIDNAAENLKNEFLAQLSHEIRTPLNIVLNYVSLLKEVINQNTNENLDKIFQIIQNSGKRLERTIDSLILISQLKSKTFRISPQPINVKSDVLRPLIDEYEERAKEKGIGIYLNDESFSALLVEKDLYSLRTIVEHLLDNAIKFTHIGLIEISISGEEKRSVITVRDTGIGMSEDCICGLFKPFQQFDEVYTRKYDGNGLGLAIVRYLCELNNVELLLNSSKQSGTTFKLVFS